jgi:hypothetical protein
MHKWCSVSETAGEYLVSTASVQVNIWDVLSAPLAIIILVDIASGAAPHCMLQLKILRSMRTGNAVRENTSIVRLLAASY